MKPSALPVSWPFLLAAGLLPALVYGLHGFSGTLTRDDALNIYMAQQWAYHSVLPYQSVFIHQGPGSSFLNLLAMLAGHGLGLRDDILATRVVSWVVLSALHIPLFLFLRKLTGDRWSALLGVAVLVSCWGFGAHLVSGPNTKSWSTMLMILQFWLITERRWFTAGFIASLSALVWQPMAALAGAGFLLCAHETWRNNRPALGWHTAGLLLPWVIGLAYFQWHHAFWDLWDGMVLFNINYVSTLEDPLPARWLRFHNAIFDGFKLGSLFLFPGLLAALWYGVKQWRANRSLAAGLLLSLPLPVWWTWLDFQSYPDFYVFLPYAAAGCALLAHRLLGTHHRWLAGLVAGLFLLSAACYQSPAVGLWIKAKGVLDEQRQFAASLPLSANDTLLTMGDTTPLVILGRTNPTRHIQLNSFLLAHIERRYPGGIAAWLTMIERLQPKVILFAYGDPATFHPGIAELLARHYTGTDHYGLGVYIRRDTPPRIDP